MQLLRHTQHCSVHSLLYIAVALDEFLRGELRELRQSPSVLSLSSQVYASMLPARGVQLYNKVHFLYLFGSPMEIHSINTNSIASSFGYKPSVTFKWQYALS